MLILVTYEPRPGSEDRTAAIQQAITDNAAGRHIQPLANRWLVDTDEPIDRWMERFGSPGRILILRVQGQPGGILPQEMWDWINARVT